MYDAIDNGQAGRDRHHPEDHRQRRKGLGLSCRVEKQPEDWPIWRNPDDSQVKADPRREAWVERAKG